MLKSPARRAPVKEQKGAGRVWKNSGQVWLGGTAPGVLVRSLRSEYENTFEL